MFFSVVILHAKMFSKRAGSSYMISSQQCRGVSRQHFDVGETRLKERKKKLESLANISLKEESKVSPL